MIRTLELTPGLVVLALTAFAAVGCSMPVTLGRTGTVLDKGELRLGMASSLGIAPTTATATKRADGGPDVTYSSVSPASAHSTSDFRSVALAPLFSQEFLGALSPFGVCEAGGWFGLARLGAELRCGAHLGTVDAALSFALSTPGLLRPSTLEWRTGLDVSRAGPGLVPLVNVYVGYVPWNRGVGYHDPASTSWTGAAVALDRGEYRLSVPVGVAFVGDTDRQASLGGSVTLSLVPEWTFAHHNLESPVSAERTVRVEQTWAMFLVLRIDLVVLTQAAAPD